jgi:hypothetical protein
MSHPRRSDDGAGHPPAIQAPADVRRLLAEQISQLTTNPDLDPLRKARQLSQLAQVLLRAMEIESVAARVEAIETTLRRRKGDLARKVTAP